MAGTEVAARPDWIAIQIEAEIRHGFYKLAPNQQDWFRRQRRKELEAQTRARLHPERQEPEREVLLQDESRFFDIGGTCPICGWTVRLVKRGLGTEKASWSVGCKNPLCENFSRNAPNHPDRLRALRAWNAYAKLASE